MQLIKKRKGKTASACSRKVLRLFSAMKRNLKITLQSGHVMWPLVTFDVFHLLTAER